MLTIVLGLCVLVLALIVVVLLMNGDQPGYEPRRPSWLDASEQIRRIEQQTIQSMFSAAADADRDITGRSGYDTYPWDS